MINRGPVSGSGAGSGSGFFATVASPRRVVLRLEGFYFGGSGISAVSSFLVSAPMGGSVSLGALGVGVDVVVRRPVGRRPRAGALDTGALGAGPTPAGEGDGDSEGVASGVGSGVGCAVATSLGRSGSGKRAPTVDSSFFPGSLPEEVGSVGVVSFSAISGPPTIGSKEPPKDN